MKRTLIGAVLVLVACGGDVEPGTSAQRVSIDIPDPPHWCLSQASTMKRCMYDVLAGHWVFQPPVSTRDTSGLRPRFPVWAENCLRDGAKVAAFMSAHGPAYYCERGLDTVAASMPENPDADEDGDGWYAVEEWAAGMSDTAPMDSAEVADAVDTWWDHGQRRATDNVTDTTRHVCYHPERGDMLGLVFHTTNAETIRFLTAGGDSIGDWTCTEADPADTPTEETP